MRSFSFSIFFQQLIKSESATLKDLRFYNEWKKMANGTYSSLTTRSPWINFPAIHFLKNQLHPGFKIFEYGSGGSTLFFLDNAAEVVSVEHDPVWFGAVSEYLTQQEKQRWQGVLLLPEKSTEIKPLAFDLPDDYYSSDSTFSDFTFTSYVKYIDRFPDNYFDLVLIDGRARPSCVKHAVPKVKRGGLLVLDNAERKYYLTHASGYLDGYRLLQGRKAPIPFIKHFVQTNIYKRLT